MIRFLLLIVSLIVLFYSCSSDGLTDNGDELVIEEREKLFKYSIETISSGDFEKYSSAITVFAQGNSIITNSIDTTAYLAHYPLNLQKENTFDVNSSNKLYVRIFLGENTSKELADKAQIKIKIFQNNVVTREDLFKLEHNSVRNIVFIDIEPCN